MSAYIIRRSAVIRPRSIELTKMPNFPNFVASVFVRFINAPFDAAEYA
jgi:hypothetical protein